MMVFSSIIIIAQRLFSVLIRSFEQFGFIAASNAEIRRISMNQSEKTMPLILIEINQIIIKSVLSLIPLREYTNKMNGAHVSVCSDCFIKSCSYVCRGLTGGMITAGNPAWACNLPEYKQKMGMNSP
jgi:hypothetical protein